jgi:hypothetical protein
MQINYKISAFLDNILTFIANRHLYQLLTSSFEESYPGTIS